MRLILAVVIIFLLGCSTPIKFELPQIVTASSLVKRASSNKYLVVIKGHKSYFNGPACPLDKLDEESIKISDDYIETDIRETVKLATSKGYEVYSADSDSGLEAFFDKLVKFSDDQTQLMVAMSGECDSKGFIINLVSAGSFNLVPADKKLIAGKIIAHLGLIKGKKAVIINGCQSGCFADAARKDSDFKGVVITACRIGFATTQCEHTGTSAIYAGFLGLYQDNPKVVNNLATIEIKAGSSFENFRHHLADVGSDGLPISYDPDIYFTSDFNF
jgi:hypothetical protein